MERVPSTWKALLKKILWTFEVEPRHKPLFFHGISHLLWRMADFVPGRLGFVFRRGIGKAMFAHLGKGARIRDHNIIFDGKRLSIGENFTSGKYNYFAGGEIRVGDNVRMANFVMIETTGHYFTDPAAPIKNQGVFREAVTIEDDVWIADRAVILPGVTIGRGSIIGAAAVVTNDIPAFSVAVGNPARVIKNRSLDSQAKE